MAPLAARVSADATHRAACAGAALFRRPCCRRSLLLLCVPAPRAVWRRCNTPPPPGRLFFASFCVRGKTAFDSPLCLLSSRGSWLFHGAPLCFTNELGRTDSSLFPLQCGVGSPVRQQQAPQLNTAPSPPMCPHPLTPSKRRHPPRRSFLSSPVLTTRPPTRTNTARGPSPPYPQQYDDPPPSATQRPNSNPTLPPCPARIKRVASARACSPLLAKARGQRPSPLSSSRTTPCCCTTPWRLCASPPSLVQVPARVFTAPSLLLTILCSPPPFRRKDGAF